PRRLRVASCSSDASSGGTSAPAAAAPGGASVGTPGNRIGSVVNAPLIRRLFLTPASVARRSLQGGTTVGRARRAKSFRPAPHVVGHADHVRCQIRALSDALCAFFAPRLSP